MKSTPTEEMMMKKSNAVKYTFFPKVFDDHEKNDNMCVFNTFVATYSRTIKKLTQERFIELCYQVQGIQITKTNSLNSLDKDIEDDEEPNMIKNTWIKLPKNLKAEAFQLRPLWLMVILQKKF